MPFVRCKFYSCHRKGCAFVHPGDSDWNNAPPPSSKARDRSGDSGSFKSWGGKRGAGPPSPWDASTNTADTESGWGATSGWSTMGEWATGNGWGGTGWDAEGSASTPNQAPETAQPNNTSTTRSRDTSALRADSASGNPKVSELGWGAGADNATGSGWGNTGHEGWGSGWGDNKGADKAGGSGWGSTQNGTWGSGWGDNKDTTNSWGAPEPVIVETNGNKGRGKTVPAPPRIRIPDVENKKPKITGTNKEPLGPSKRGEPRSSNFVTASTPVTTTPTTMTTPTDSTRLKRKRDVAFEDNFEVFKEYVKTWERGVRARFSLAEAEAKRDRWFRTQKSACYARIGEAGRKRLDGQRAECDQEVNSQREKLSCAITSLVEFHDTISSNLDFGQRYKIDEEAEKFITESKAFVDEIRALVVAHVLKDKNDIQSDDIERHPSGTDVTSIDSLRNQLRVLEGRFDQAQTELTLGHQRDIRSEVHSLLAAKIAALRIARQREVDRIASQPRPEIVIPPSSLKNMESTAKQVSELDAKVPHTVEDIRVLLLRVDATTKRVNELEEELSMNKATYGKQVEEMAAEKEETERRIDERLEKIRDQFKQLAASQPTLPVSPTIGSSREKLMENLRPAFEAVLDKFYEQEVQPTIESMQQIVIQASNRHQEEAIKVLWGKIQPAMNMVAGVSRWLDSQELALTAPVEINQAYASGL